VLTGVVSGVAAASATARTIAGGFRPAPDKFLLNGLQAALPP